VTLALEHRNEIAYDHIPANRRTGGRALIWVASLGFLAILLAQILNRAGVLSFGFETWRPVLYAYALWGVALGVGQVLIRGEPGKRALFVLPAVLFTVAVVIFPTLFGFYIALTDWNLSAAGGPKFNGLDNFVTLLNDPYFWNALLNMVFYSAAVLLEYAIAFGLALLLNAEIRARKFFRVAFLLPFMLQRPRMYMTVAGAEHEREQEGDPEKLARPDLGIEQERQPEGDGVFQEHGGRIKHHIQQRVPEIRVVQQRDEIIEAVEFRAAGRAQVPVRERDVEAEQSREDHHGDGEQHGWQDKERAFAGLAADEHLADAERHAPQRVRVQHRAPGFKAEGQHAGPVQDLGEQDGQEAQRSDPDQGPAAGSTVRRDVIVCDLIAVFEGERHRASVGRFARCCRSGRRDGNGWSRSSRHQPSGCSSRLEAGARWLKSERGLVERDLALTADLVGDTLPLRRNTVGAGLRLGPAGEDLRQLVFGHAVILEDAGNARLDGRVRVVVGIAFRFEV
jgi:hypothetical protein